MDFDHIAWMSLFDVAACQDQFHISGDVTLPQLLGYLLNYYLFRGKETGMFGHEGQLSINSVFLAFLRLALLDRGKFLIKYLQIVLTAANFALESSDRKSRFDLISPDNNSLDNSQAANHISPNLVNSPDKVRLSLFVSDEQIVPPLHLFRHSLIRSPQSALCMHVIFLPLFHQCILYLISQFLRILITTSSGLKLLVLLGRITSIML